MDTVIGKLKPEQYWEWRTTISEMECAKHKNVSNELRWEMMLKDIEISKLKTAIYKNTVEASRGMYDKAKEEYEAMKTKIEKDLGISLSGAVIDDTTFEVKKLEEDVK